ncbi:hypothetical protein GQR58_016522 [Nymphon striatum]|nr:hypothetical protein GQR58_016522 [Nymphon striatum]
MLARASSLSLRKLSISMYSCSRSDVESGFCVGLKFGTVYFKIVHILLLSIMMVGILSLCLISSSWIHALLTWRSMLIEKLKEHNQDVSQIQIYQPIYLQPEHMCLFYIRIIVFYNIVVNNFQQINLYNFQFNKSIFHYSYHHSCQKKTNLFAYRISLSQNTPIYIFSSHFSTMKKVKQQSISAFFYEKSQFLYFFSPDIEEPPSKTPETSSQGVFKITDISAKEYRWVVKPKEKKKEEIFNPAIFS